MQWLFMHLGSSSVLSAIRLHIATAPSISHLRWQRLSTDKHNSLSIPLSTRTIPLELCTCTDMHKDTIYYIVWIWGVHFTYLILIIDPTFIVYCILFFLLCTRYPCAAVSILILIYLIFFNKMISSRGAAEPKRANGLLLM